MELIIAIASLCISSPDGGGIVRDECLRYYVKCYRAKLGEELKKNKWFLNQPELLARCIEEKK